MNKVDKKCGKANFLKGGKDLVQKSYAKGLFIFLSRSETLESFQFCIGVNGGFIKGERDCTNIDKNASFTPSFLCSIIKGLSFHLLYRSVTIMRHIILLSKLSKISGLLFKKGTKKLVKLSFSGVLRDEKLHPVERKFSP